MEGVGWLAAIIIGGLAGWIAASVMKTGTGLIANIVLGIVGAVVLNAILVAAMGYTYLAVGGMVPLKSDQIRAALQAIRDAVPAATRLHILGFAKANEIASFTPYGVTSFDTTSPLIRAFKDAKQNYFVRTGPGRLKYYMAIRVPQALENLQLQRLVRVGAFRAEDLAQMEREALAALRAFQRHEASVDDVLAPVLRYNAIVATGRPYDEVKDTPTMAKLGQGYRETLAERPWVGCRCTICRSVGIEVMLFRASNRNKRRGIHNLSVYNDIVQDLTVQSEEAYDEADIPRRLRAAES